MILTIAYFELQSFLQLNVQFFLEEFLSLFGKHMGDTLSVFITFFLTEAGLRQVYSLY